MTPLEQALLQDPDLAELGMQFVASARRLHAALVRACGDKLPASELHGQLVDLAVESAARESAGHGPMLEVLPAAWRPPAPAHVNLPAAVTVERVDALAAKLGVRRDEVYVRAMVAGVEALEAQLGT